MSNEIRLEGWGQFKTKLNALPKKIENQYNSYVKDGVKEWEQLAKRAAPKDQGMLIRGISGYMVSLGIGEVVSPAAHSRFVEWGTKGKKIVPSDMAAYESGLSYQKSGDYYDFLNSILDWVKRKGLAKITNSYTGKSRTKKNDLIMVAEAVAWSIMKKGINPHPYFFIQKPIVEKKLIDRLHKLVNTPQ